MFLIDALLFALDFFMLLSGRLSLVVNEYDLFVIVSFSTTSTCKSYRFP